MNCHRYMREPALTIMSEPDARWYVEIQRYGPKCAKIVQPTPAKRPEPAPRVRRVRAAADAGQQDLFALSAEHQAQ